MSTALTKELPEQVVRRGITAAQWNTLCFSLFPGARPESVYLVWDYCLARQLDPLKKPCHIVPMEIRNTKTGTYEWRDVILPGIYEYRTTAQRTKEYDGHSAPEYGPLETFGGIPAPAWCAMTFYRWNRTSGRRVEYPVKVFFAEVVALNNKGKPNARWAKAPTQMLTKCTEAAGLREAFPDELGGEPTFEEMVDQRAAEAPMVEASGAALVKPAHYDDWLHDLEMAADEGAAKFDQTWEESPLECRAYLSLTDLAKWETLKAKAVPPAAEESRDDD